MRYLILAVAILILFSATTPTAATAGERRKKEGAQQLQGLSQAGATEAEKKQALINNFNIMRNQELRVILLQQMLNEEVTKLGNLQEQFCRLYNLDINKLRQGLYRYDDAQQKFVEAQPQAPQLPQAQQQ